MTRDDAPDQTVDGLVRVDGTDWYQVGDVDDLDPFLMSIVSDGDRWSFVSSAGPLTAGRVDAAGALLPYETDDRLHAAAGRIGPVTAMRVDGQPWLPWRDRDGGQRLIRKAVTGDEVVFEEHHHTGLVWRTSWASTEAHGFVRTTTLSATGTRPVDVEAVDGLVGILPPGVDPDLQLLRGNLANAYKRSEVIDAARDLALYTLEAPVSDRAEAQEVLRATVAWSIAPGGTTVHLDPAMLADFEAGADLADLRAATTTAPLTGRPGSYLLAHAARMAPGDEVTWHLVADVGLDHADVAALRREAPTVTAAHLQREVQAGRGRLLEIMARADGLQHTADPVETAHHLANVTFNVMRGGVPLDGHVLDTRDVSRVVARRNTEVAARHAAWFADLPTRIDRADLVARARATGDPHLLRLVREYLPFSFSRRHGDPSRPWNRFAIRVRDEAGEPVIHWEGNWRDVFQNWEALCASHPAFLPGVVALFVNASTIDGHNPYRITSDGIDWEVPDPDDPWSNIGYWGDHQVVYLLRLLEAAERHDPGAMSRMLAERAFTYADVPYVLASHDDMLASPRSTITWDREGAAATARRVAAVGTDGKLLTDADGAIVTVTLFEKLLVPALAKLSNLVPGGGIWMNTQRPEWNDANNALVGWGLSMVTLHHLRAYLAHLRDLVAAGPERVAVSERVAAWLDAVTTGLDDVAGTDAIHDDRARQAAMDRLGRAAAHHRATVRASGPGSPVDVAGTAVVALCDVALPLLDETIWSTRRDDGLFDAYNLWRPTADGEGIAVERLPAMLEGQVAALSGGALDPTTRADLVDALYASDLHRADQDSFVLQPIRVPPSFMERNVVPDDDVRGNELLAALLDDDDGAIVRRDVDGVVRFRPELVDDEHLVAALEGLDTRWHDLVERWTDATRTIYEDVFGHRRFVGRSGSMYAYEGIGSIYWHMVTKLLLAVQEAAVAALERDPAAAVRLAAQYWRIRGGLGVGKTAQAFGAIPTDPYSHTPLHAGAQQPGMTGAVKEELLARPLELGVRIDDGCIVGDPQLLHGNELTRAAQPWRVLDVAGSWRDVQVPAGSVASTLCQVPVVVTPGDEDAVTVSLADGGEVAHRGRRLPRDLSAAVLGRTGEVARIEIRLAGVDTT